MNNPIRRALAPTFLTACFVWASTAEAATVTARIEPEVVGRQQSAQLTVEVADQAARPPQVPEVAGLSIEPVGQSMQTSIVNGARSMTTSWIYRVTPARPGEYAIPPIRVGGEATEPLTLEVTDEAPSRRAPTASRGQANLPPDDEAADDTADPSQDVLLRMSLKKKDVYVGEKIPVTIRAYFPPGVGVTVQGLPEIDAEGVTLDPPTGEPRQRETTLDGKPYLEASWSASLTFVKSGPQTVDVRLPATLQWRERSSRSGRRSPLEDMFSDDFDALFSNGNMPSMARAFSMLRGFDPSDMFGNVRTKEVMLRRGRTRVDVAPLPEGGRPASFSGAVGEFDISIDAPETDVAVGEPVTLRFTITGRGNFERLAFEGVPTSDALKTYAPSVVERPTRQGRSDAEVFEQVVMARQAGTVEVPALQFAYFDPNRGAYVERSTPPIRLDVRPAPAGVAAVSAAPTPGAGEPAEAQSDALDPVQTELGRLERETIALHHRAWFLPSAIALFLIPAGALVARRRRARGPSHRALARARRRGARGALMRLDAAAAGTDVTAFLDAAYDAVRTELGRRWSMPPEAITRTDVEARLGREHESVALFDLIDRARYGAKPTTIDFGRWRAVVARLLEEES